MATLRELHAAAFTALMAPTLTVYANKVPTGLDVAANPYVFVRDVFLRPDLDFDSKAYGFAMRRYCYCVSASQLGAQRLADLLETAVLDVTPTVAGRSCYPIRWDDSGGEPQVDETLGTTVATVTEVYLLASIPG